MNRIAKELREHHAALGFSDIEETWLKELREHHAALGFSDSEETWLTAAADEIERLREALRLADAALRGSNMNMKVVEKKVLAALGKEKE